MINGDPAFERGLSELSDELLVSAAQAGDALAFVELKDRHANKLMSRIYRITRNWQDAEDVLQESFLRAFLHLPTFEGRSSFSSWITRIAINCALMLLRKRRAVEISIDALSIDGETWSGWEIADIRRTPEEAYAQREVEQHLRSAIRRLRPALRKVVHLRRSEDYSTGEIAAALGISAAAAKSRLLRAKMALRASMLWGRSEVDHVPKNCHSVQRNARVGARSQPSH
jgi:RNA polymerase sigma-70 factor (ECF subfamily)